MFSVKLLLLVLTSLVLVSSFDLDQLLARRKKKKDSCDPTKKCYDASCLASVDESFCLEIDGECPNCGDIPNTGGRWTCSEGKCKKNKKHKKHD